jgi:hypothetical protein
MSTTISISGSSTKIRESDYVYPYHYSGTANINTPTSSPTWTIYNV